MKSNALLVGMTLVLFGACEKAPAPEPSVDLEAERAALRAAADAYHAAAQSSDFDTIKTLYTSDARIFPPNQAEESGTAGVNHFVDTFSSLPGFDISFEPPAVVVGPDGGMGFTIAPTVIRFEGPDGAMVEQSVRDLHIWRRDADGKWKVVIDMWNTPTPLPEAGE